MNVNGQNNSDQIKDQFLFHNESKRRSFSFWLFSKVFTCISPKKKNVLSKWRKRKFSTGLFIYSSVKSCHSILNEKKKSVSNSFNYFFLDVGVEIREMSEYFSFSFEFNNRKRSVWPILTSANLFFFLSRAKL